MTRQTFHLLCLLVVLIVSGCTTAPYRVPAPYPARPLPQPPVKRHPAGPGPGQPSAGQPANPIVVDISNQASRLVQNGQLDAAAQTLERGLRIAPKNASLWSQLAAVRLQQQRYGQARSLAAKSNSLAAGNLTVIRNNLRIIAEAQRAAQ